MQMFMKNAGLVIILTLCVSCGMQVKRDLGLGFDCVLMAEPGWSGNNLFKIKTNANSDNTFLGLSRRRQIAEQRAYECGLQGAVALAERQAKTLTFPYGNPPATDKKLGKDSQSALRESAFVFEKIFTESDECSLSLALRLPKTSFLMNPRGSNGDKSGLNINTDRVDKPSTGKTDTSLKEKPGSLSPKETKESNEPVLDF